MKPGITAASLSGDPAGPPQRDVVQVSGPLSAFVDAWCERRPDEIAWCDQPGRETWSGRPSRRLDWRGIREHSADLASRLSRLGLAPGAFVGLCLPNGVDWLIAILGVERAGLTPCLLPVSSTRDELASAVETVGIEAIVTQTEIGPIRPAELVCRVAAGCFRLRHVLAFGPRPPDGVADLDAARGRVHAAADLDPRSSRGLVTFERSASPWRPVLRPYASLVAAGGSLVAALRPERDDALVTLLAPDDLKAAVSGLMLPLVSGCRLEAHGLFSADDLERACGAQRGVAWLVTPGWMEPALRTYGVGPRTRLILAHDAPTRLPLADPDSDVVDLLALGEDALVAAPRRRGLAASISGDPDPGERGAAVWLRIGIDSQDGAVSVGGPAAAALRLDEAVGSRAPAPGMQLAAAQHVTPFRVDRSGDRIVGVSRVA